MLVLCIYLLIKTFDNSYNLVGSLYIMTLWFSFFSVFDVCRKAALLFGWAVFLLLAYKVSKLDREYQEYNPYEVLHLDPVSMHAHTHTHTLL